MNATSSASGKRMHIAYTRRRRCRGTYYKEYVLAYVSGIAERQNCSFSNVVNRLLDKTISEGLSEVEETLGLQVRKARLLEEEASLRETLRVILRSGAYLKDYAKELLLGDFKQISNLRNRAGIFSQITPRELNVILRILKRREDVVGELLEIEDKLLPSEPYPFMVTEHGWKLGDFHYARDSRRLEPEAGRSKPKQKTGGEKPK
jgi:hypothetical protein